MEKYKTVAEFLSDLDEDKLAQVEALRDIILKTEPKLEEHIKWNAPSYIFNGEDRITFNLLNKEGVVKLIIHMGAKRKEDKKAKPIMQDESGLVEWNSDIRGILTFPDIKAVKAKSTSVEKVLQNWLAIPV